MKIDGVTISQHPNHKCLGNKVHSVATISMIVTTFCHTNITTKYKTVLLSLELHPSNCKGNYMSFYMDMNVGIIFQYSIKCILETTSIVC